MEYYVVGNADYAKMLCRYIGDTLDRKVSGYVVCREFIQTDAIGEVPLIAYEDFIGKVNADSCRLYMGIGYRNMNQIKEKEYLRYKASGYIFENYIHPTAIISSNAVLGEANNIFEGVIIQEGVRLGNANLVYGGAMIAHETCIKDYNSFSVKSCVAGCVNVGNNCFIGANATVRDHIRLADYTLVGAGTYLSASTKEYDVAVCPKAVVLEEKKSVEFI